MIGGGLQCKQAQQRPIGKEEAQRHSFLVFSVGTKAGRSLSDLTGLRSLSLDLGHGGGRHHQPPLSLRQAHQGPGRPRRGHPPRRAQPASPRPPGPPVHDFFFLRSESDPPLHLHPSTSSKAGGAASAARSCPRATSRPPTSPGLPESSDAPTTPKPVIIIY